MAVRRSRTASTRYVKGSATAAVWRRWAATWRLEFRLDDNIGHSVYAAWGPVSNIIVAAILGPASAGLFKIASTLVDSTSKPADLISRGFYPEIMRLDPASKAPWRLVFEPAPSPA